MHFLILRGENFYSYCVGDETQAVKAQVIVTMNVHGKARWCQASGCRADTVSEDLPTGQSLEGEPLLRSNYSNKYYCGGRRDPLLLGPIF